jgi:hypothetical protein
LDFIRIIRSVEELVFEIMSWIVFYPYTLWRAVRHPLALAIEVSKVMKEDVDHEFRHHLSPILFLLISIGLAHAIELGMNENVQLAPSRTAAVIEQSDLFLIILRATLWGLVPLVIGLGHEVISGRRISRDGLRARFLEQCFYAGPLALGLSTAIALGRYQASDLMPYALTLGAITAFWFLATQVIWTRHELNVSTPRAAGLTLFWITCAVAVNLIVTVMIQLV